MATLEDLITDAQSRMGKSVEHARTEFNTVRTGRASAALLDRIEIDYYGTKTQLTEERRKKLAKVVRHMAEEHKVAVREIRRDTMKHLKELVDNGDVGADEEHRGEERVQKLTDDHTKQIDELLKHKEAEVMEV